MALHLPQKASALSDVLVRLRDLGLSPAFLVRRLAPQLSEHGSETGDADTLALQLASLVGRVFGWPPESLLSQIRPEAPIPALGATRFKLPAKANDTRAALYAAYGHYIASLAIRASRHDPSPVPTDAAAISTALSAVVSSSIYRDVLVYVWRLGIPVVPLAEPGGFHAASWRIGGRNVVMLKQNTASSARWSFDLLHELWHLGHDPHSPTLAVIEGDVFAEARDSAEEQEANEFAADALLRGRAQELFMACRREAGGRIAFFKRATTEIAEREGVNVGVLANYVAYHLSRLNLNWWGAATNLQSNTEDPWRITRECLLSRVDLGCLDEPDAELFSLALRD